MQKLINAERILFQKNPAEKCRKMMTEKRKQLCGYISIATLSTRFFSENCLQTPLSLNTKNNLQYFRSLFWKKLIENNKESYCRPTKLTPKIWVPNSKKKHPKKSLAKRNPPLVSTQETVFVVTKFCPNPKCYIWSRAPRTHSSIRTSPNPGEKKIKFGGETEKPSSEQEQQKLLWHSIRLIASEGPF